MRRSVAKENVIRIFPNEASALRLLGALLMERDDTWSTGRRYFMMQTYLDWRRAKAATTDRGEAA